MTDRHQTKFVLKQRYRLEKVIGQGGIGCVYLAQDLHRNQEVAIKQCKHTSEKIVERFKREYKFLCSIKHPNIVMAYDFFQERSNYFLVMEYIPGITLGDLLEKEHPLSLLHRLKIAIQICKAVSALNVNRIVHRDIKPDNIIVTEKGIIKLLDLGIAKTTNKELSGITKTGVIIGTPEYISPEQITDKERFNSDVFSIGVVIYQIILGLKKSPFLTKSLAGTLNKVVGDRLPLIKDKVKDKKHPSAYAKLSAAVDKALEKNPHQRTKSAKELGVELLQIYQALQENESSHGDIDYADVGYQATNEYKVTDEPVLEEENLTQITQARKVQNMLVISQVVSFVLIITLLVFFYILKSKNNSLISQTTKLEETVSDLLNQKSIVSQMLIDRIIKNDLLSKNRVEMDLIQANYYLDKDQQQALKYFDAAIKKLPSYSDAYFGKGLLFQMQKNYTAALEFYNKAININNSNAYYYSNRGGVYFRLSQYTKALQDYDRAIMLDPSHASYYVNRASIYSSLSLYEKVVDDCTKAIELRGDDPVSYSKRGRALYRLRSFRKAKSDLEKSLQLGIDNTQQVKWLIKQCEKNHRK
ncbi:protein kinase [Candidatus Uabimicrobium sp. HlEnr_7]|uniref:serine/threonine-protein kinase n=1 Tax=Candidatus Uabimicrobium helgolandensis TaxID=3095367 RepID=UPI00355752EB